MDNDYCDNTLICHRCKKNGDAACISGNLYILLLVDLFLVQDEQLKFLNNNIEMQSILAWDCGQCEAIESV